MEPITSAILLGIISNALYTVLSKSSKQILDKFTGEDLLSDIKYSENKYETLLENAIEEFTNKIENIEIKIDIDYKIEKISLFFYSPEFETLIRQLFSTDFIKQNSSVDINHIKKEFSYLLSHYLQIPFKKIERDCNNLFNSFLSVCSRILDNCIRHNNLTAHEVKSSYRFNILHDEIKNIQKNLKYLTDLKKINVEEVNEFEKKLREQIKLRVENIIPPNFDNAKKININDLYVCPHITKKDGEGYNRKLIEYKRFLKILNKVVLLGNPGGGKSTFSKKLCYDICLDYDARLISSKKLTPILIVLRDYAVLKKQKQMSILDFVISNIHSDYQLNVEPKYLEYLILNGRLLFIFDGLDELLDTAYRGVISSDIESFSNLYPALPIIVTSREVGYDQAPLNESRFQIYKISPFDENQISEYVNKWFNLDNNLTTEEKQNKINSFLEESKIAPDLRENALMLALLCSIYRGENYIPRNRPELYEKCALMLFERWDKSRGLHDPPFEANLKPAMMYLAHWIYTNINLENGVTESQLIKKSVEYLYPKKYEDIDEANKYATEFIIFCRGRAWVFTDTGTTKDGENLYQFTHRTFLEYFTALYITRIHSDAKLLLDHLYPHISLSEWDVVSQLALQILNKNIEEGANDFLEDLISRYSDNELKNINIIGFLNRTLSFIVPNPKIVRRIISESLMYYYNLGIKNYDLYKKNTNNEDLEIIEPDFQKTLSSIFSSSSENLNVIFSEVELVCKQLCDHAKSTKEILIVFEIISSIYSVFTKEKTISEKCEKLYESLSSIYENKFIDVYDKEFRIAFNLFLRNKIPISSLLNSYGVNSIFISKVYFVNPHMRNIELSAILINIINEKNNHFIKMNFDVSQSFNDLGEFISSNIKKIDFNILQSISLRWYIEEFTDVNNLISNINFQKLNNYGHFAIWYLLAIFTEFSQIKEHDMFKDKISIENISNSKNYYSAFVNILQKRINSVEQLIINNIFKFNEHQVKLIEDWANKTIDLIDYKS